MNSSSKSAWRSKGALGGAPDPKNPLAAREVSQMIRHKCNARTSEDAERMSVGPKSVIEAAKQAVSTHELAERLCGQLRRVGERLTACCPLHDERTPSFVVYPDGGFFCFGCNTGGPDAIRLAKLAWGHARADTAAADLLHTFGYEIPPRPKAWYAKGERQARARRELEAAKMRRVQRRIYRWLFKPIIARLEDDAERCDEAAAAWEEAGRVAHALVIHLEQGGAA
jgi:hypothetical protein